MSKYTITLSQALDLLAHAFTQFVDGREAIVQVGHTNTGNPDNVVLMIRWEDAEGQEYAMDVIEEGLADGSEKIWWDDEEGIMSLPDDDGDIDNPLQLQLVVKMGRQYI